MKEITKEILVCILVAIGIGGCNYEKENMNISNDMANYMVFNILRTKEISLPAYYHLKDINGGMCRLDSVFTKPSIVFRFSEFSCDNCIESSLKVINESEMSENIIGLASYNNLRMLKLAQKKYNILFPVYFISMGDLEMLSEQNEKSGNPYLFLLDSDFKGRYFFSPSQQYPEILKEYLKQSFAMLEEKKVSGTDIFHDKNKNLGTIIKGEKYEIEFEYTNNTNDLLVINDVKSSCECLVSQWKKEPLSSGKTAKLIVEFKPENLGYASKTIMVSHNKSAHPIRLMIKANVVTDIKEKKMN